MKKEIHGLMPPMITVFKNDGNPDLEKTRKHARWLIEQGVHGLIPCGSTGEFTVMSLEDRMRVAEAVVEEVRGEVPVYIGTAHYSTKMAIDLSKHAEDIGADGVMLVAPYYLNPTEREIAEHYRAVAKSISIPLMAYNNPHYAGAELSVLTMVKLAEEGCISSVKEAQGDPSRVHDLKYFCGDKLKVFYGHDVCALEGLMTADGWVAGIGNLIPADCRKLVDLMHEKKDIIAARDHWYKILKIIHMCVNRKNGERPDWLAIIKEGLNMQGRDVGVPQRPILGLREEDRVVLQQVLLELGLLSTPK